MKLRQTDKAREDLRALRAYFDEHNPAAGRAIAARIKHKLTLLRKNPEMGRPVEGRPGVRELVVDNYVLPYMLEGGAIVVLRVWHGAQDR